jgi:predicted metal-dependent peptidase
MAANQKKEKDNVSVIFDNIIFYAHFFLESTIQYDRLDVPTAAVTVDRNGTKMIFNTSFMNSLNEEEACGIIEHEVLHLLFLHIYIKDHNMGKNIAQDCTINQYILLERKRVLN